MLVPASVVVTSCGDDDSSDANASSHLPPTDDVEAAEDASDSADAAFGTPFTVGEVMTLIDSITVVEESDSTDRPFLVVHVRSENASSEEQSNPDIGIACTGFEEPGDGLAYSTWMPYEALPPDSFRDGFVWLTSPGDPRTGEPTSDCVAPAHLRVQPLTSGGTVDLSLDEEVIAALNDEGCGSGATEVMLESTVIGPPVVCASFGDGPKPDTEPA